MLLFWLIFAALGLGAAVLGVRCMMIEASMVAELTKHDPTFQPRYGQVDRMYNIREYLRRMPKSLLAAKLRHTRWAMVCWAVLGITWLGLLPAAH